ncbi:Gfo/Idh/MocA family protein [Parvularcula maris]|uniref:Gfo/Idh/MocA family oxidoreductase n=1 Tax=Parvularcula maris TaxID=2965077 RepID=A0A9X2RHA3_9PROT|nr:Gfo/Idh/MocA family oxidoreductase [Parvularcula maris]MCQ8184664.1 Gfo/Idh/MocA family oxidoreductase [Parvularcula maris]
MIRLGIIGAGWVARDFALPAIEAAQDGTLVAVADPKEGVPGYPQYQDHQAMLDAEKLDAIYVASPNHLHPQHVLDALHTGCHVLCEKPLAIASSDAEEMAALATRRGLVLQTAFDQRHHPAHRLMKQLVQEGTLGTLTQVRIDYACWVDEEFLPDNWRIEAERAGGGAVIDLAPHGLDLVEYLTGERLTTLHVLRQRRLHGYAVDDGGVLTGRTESGILLSQTVGYNRPEKLPRRRLEIIGSEGILLAENTMGQTPGGCLTLTTSSGERRSIEFGQTPPFEAQFDSFFEACNARKSDRLPTEDARLVALLEQGFEGDAAWR